MSGEKPNIYDVEFDIYSIDFELFQDQVIPSDDRLADEGPPETAVEIRLGASAALKTTEQAAQLPQLEPDLSEVEQGIVDFLRTLPPQVHIGRFIRSYYGVPKLGKSDFNILLQMMDDLTRKGYVNHEPSSQYYGAPLSPNKLCTCFECRVCQEVDDSEQIFAVAACFTGKLVTRAMALVSEQTEDGIKWTEIARDYAEELLIEQEAARELVRNLEKQRLLYRTGVHKGTRLLTTDPQFEVAVEKRKTVKERGDAEMVWTEEKIVTASLLLDELAKVGQFQQGSTFARLHRQVSEFMQISEPACKQILRMLEKEGVVLIGVNWDRQQKTKTSNASKVMFNGADARHRWKNEREAMVKELKQLITSTGV
jgi:hypothetical protein